MKMEKVIACLVAFCVIVVILLVGVLIFAPPIFGLPPFGERNEVVATVQSKHIDNNGDAGSSYMVVTDKGVFEVNNSLWLWLWNSDEIYGKIEVGKTFTFSIKGRKCANFIFQKYPYIEKIK
jgi:hypothetical protein